MARLLLIPLVLAAAACVGYGLLRSAGRAPHPREMSAALAATTLASLAAVAPALAVRRKGQAAVVQFGFYGSVSHLFLTVALGAAVVLLYRVPPKAPFLLWLLWFYWASLALVSVLLIGAIRSTPVASPAESPEGAGERPARA